MQCNECNSCDSTYFTCLCHLFTHIHTSISPSVPYRRAVDFSQHARSIASSANRGHTCTVMRRRKTSGPSERNELSLNARGSIHSTSVAQEVHSVGSYVADRPRVALCVHRSAHVCTMCLHRLYLHTGSAIGDEMERISSPSQCRRCAKSRRVTRLDVNVTKPALNHATQHI